MPVIFAFFVFFTLVLLIFYSFFFQKFLRYKPEAPEKNDLPVSVIICAKDESENLKRNLPLIYTQNYPNFEVVLIDDRSIDDTFDIMQTFKEQYPAKTKLVKVNFNDDNRLRGNKKYALTLGIKAASYNHLLFTDADCRPVSSNWIDNMSRHFSQKALILGYGPYAKRSGFLNKLIRYETVQTALQYFSYALKTIPYMGVGRNLAYTKDLFMNNNGFYSHLDVLSGDDDLFVNEVATPQNTAICLSPESFMYSSPKKTWKEFVRQKRRHISTAKHYKKLHQFLLGLYFLSLTGFWLTGIFLLSTLYLWPWVISLMLFRTGIAWYINVKVNEKLHENDLSIWYPFLEIGLLSFQLLIFVLNLFKKPAHWTR